MIVGLLLGIVGMIVLVGPELSEGLAEENALAVIAVLIGTVSWSAGSLRSRMIDMAESLFMSAAVQMAVGGGAILLIGILLGETADLRLEDISTASYWAWLYLVALGSFAAFSAYVWLLGHASPKQISSYAFVNPVVAIFLGWWLRDEVIYGRIILAMVIMVAAVSMIVIYGKSEQARD